MPHDTPSSPTGTHNQSPPPRSFIRGSFGRLNSRTSSYGQKFLYVPTLILLTLFSQGSQISSSSVTPCLHTLVCPKSPTVDRYESNTLIFLSFPEWCLVMHTVRSGESDLVHLRCPCDSRS